MKIGAQLFSLKPFIQTPEDTRETFRKLREMGYETVQWSAGGPLDPHELAEISREYQLPIVCTHVSFERLTTDLDAVIEEHKILGCPVIGLGAMAKPWRTEGKDYTLFFEEIAPVVKKIHAAGLQFAYHNHDFDFHNTMPDGEPVFDYMIRTCTDWQFIMDTYWIEFTGRSAVEYIAKIGKDRLANIHFKDMADDEKHSICACGDGTLDFAAIYEACKRMGGVENILIEQDNAPKKDDPFGEMQKSYNAIRSIVK